MDAAHDPELLRPEAWFHSHVFPDGEAVRGDKAIDVLQREAEVVFRHGVAGKSVLDIGARDGWFSFEAERRGARRVLATELFWSAGTGWGSKAGFDYAHARYGSKAESRQMDVHDISTENPGVFDTVLMLGVLYHLKDPLVGLEHAASVTGETLVVETVTAFDPFPWKLSGYFEGAEFNNDPSNFWAPNRRCLEAMLRDVGFKRIETVRNPNVVPNWRQPQLYWRHSRVITHAHREGAA
jgi:tRNA (mo5U34)-methyltransferase